MPGNPLRLPDEAIRLNFVQLGLELLLERAPFRNVRGGVDVDSVVTASGQTDEGVLNWESNLKLRDVSIRERCNGRRWAGGGCGLRSRGDRSGCGGGSAYGDRADPESQSKGRNATHERLLPDLLIGFVLRQLAPPLYMGGVSARLRSTASQRRPSVDRS